MYWQKKTAPTETPLDEQTDFSPEEIREPKNAEDVAALLERFGPMLTEENRRLLQDTVTLLKQESPGDKLETLAKRYRAACGEQQV